jgi:transcriptional regulator with PAS, ATPase and Fis domain
MATARANLKIVTMHKKATERALVAAHGNRTKAAKLLGVSVRTVRNWIKRYHLEAKYPYQRGRQK